MGAINFPFPILESQSLLEDLQVNLADLTCSWARFS